MSPPEKKMKHLEAINAIPSLYPDFRTVLWTGETSQLVVMTVPVGGDIGEEVHHVDQHLIFTSGVCKAIVAGEEKEVKAGDMVIVPQGTKHNCRSTSRVWLRQRGEGKGRVRVEDGEKGDKGSGMRDQS
jgi:mannose-6-phosphate isomerase-like protein (cupin superfamily)